MIKTIRVESGNWHKDVDVDTEIFSKVDAHMEAATKAVEWAHNTLENFDIGLVLMSYELKHKGNPDKEMIMLSYVVLNNAGLYEIAEQIRNTVLEEEGFDMLEKVMEDEKPKKKRKPKKL